MDMFQRVKNMVICEEIKGQAVNKDPRLAEDDFACGLQADVKRGLVKSMCDEALAMGAVPIRPISI